MNTFTRSVDLLQRGMSVMQLRYQVTADNIAKAEIPGCKRTVVNFESELKKAFESEEIAKNSFHLNTTNEKHIQINTPLDYRDVQPRRVVDYVTSGSADGNNIDAETEANNILKIQMQYRLLTQLASFEFDQVNTAMKK